MSALLVGLQLAINIGVVIFNFYTMRRLAAVDRQLRSLLARKLVEELEKGT